MQESIVHCDSIELSMDNGPDVVNITDMVSISLEKSKISDGIVNITVRGSTGSVSTIEFEPGVVEDLKRAIMRLAPPGLEYEHEKAWHDGNGHSHVQAALLGSSLTIGVRNSRMTLGTWQQVVIINHDNKPRNRHVDITAIGSRRVS